MPDNENEKVYFRDAERRSDEVYQRVPPPKRQENGTVHRRRKGSLSREHIIFNIVSCVLACMLIVSGSFCIVAYSYFSRINYGEIGDEIPGGYVERNTSDN